MKRNSKEFKVLEDLWYAKLKATGFDDIEKNGFIKSTTSSQALQSLRNLTPVRQSAVRSYYRLAGFLLHDYKFETKLDKMIWQYHAEGVSIRDISKNLKILKLDRQPTQIKETIHRLREIMYARYRDEDDE